MLRFRDFQVRNKILVAYFVLLVLFLGLGIYEDNASRKITYASRYIELNNFPELGLVTDIRSNVSNINNLLERFLQVTDSNEATKIRKNLDVYIVKTKQLIFELIDLRKNNQTNLEYILKIKSLFQEYSDLTIYNLKEPLAVDVIQQYKRKVIFEQLSLELKDLLNEDVAIFSAALGKISDLAAYMRNTYFWTLMLLIIFSILVAFKISEIIVNPIKKLAHGMNEFGRGNFDFNVGLINNDEIGLLQNGFIDMAKRLKLTHENLMQERNSLEIKVRERTMDLEENRNFLIQANEELKQMQAKFLQSAKMAAVGLLAGGIAHEINNPLTGVLNNVELIKLNLRGKNNPAIAEFKDALNLIEESALRCKKTVQGLLEFSHVKSIEFELTSINEILEKTIALANNEIKLENIKITKELAKELPLVMVRSNSIQQVILDIINNARWALQSIPKAELKFKSFLSEDEKSIILKISDNGCGIEEVNLEHLFEPFFTTKKIGEGTGLGLSISYQIIREHKGLLVAESEGKGKGATFLIILPVAVGKN